MSIDSERALSLFQELQEPRPPLFKANAETQERIQGVVAELCEIFSRATSESRAEIASHVQPRLSGVFLWFAQRMSVLAVRECSPDAVTMGLTALAIENGATDFRDMLMVMVLLYHSAAKLGLDPVQLFDSAASLAVNKELAKMARAFPRRTPHDRSLGAFRYEESGQGDSFGYRRLS